MNLRPLDIRRVRAALTIYLLRFDDSCPDLRERVEQGAGRFILLARV